MHGRVVRSADRTFGAIGAARRCVRSASCSSWSPSPLHGRLAEHSRDWVLASSASAAGTPSRGIPGATAVPVRHARDVGARALARRSGRARRRDLPDRSRSAASATAVAVARRAPRRDPERRLRALGCARPRAAPAHARVEPALAASSGGCRLFRGPQVGVGLLCASLVLAIMVLPTIASVSRDVLRAVPPELREGGLALGATPWDVVRRVVLPHARCGHPRRDPPRLRARGRRDDGGGRWSSAAAPRSRPRSSRRATRWRASSRTSSPRPPTTSTSRRSPRSACCSSS